MTGELGRCEEGADAWRAWALRSVSPWLVFLAGAALGVALGRRVRRG